MNDGEAFAIEARALRRDYGPLRALRHVDFAVRTGERVAVMGPSGCGKSTLLALIAGLDSPTSGSVNLAGHDLTTASRHDLARLRRTLVGYIPQSASLLPMLTVEENIELPLTLIGMDETERRDRVGRLLERVELSNKANVLPEELSGGQQQRVAIARALATAPRILLADEPTGSLDSDTAEIILSILMDEVARDGASLVMVTHETAEAARADRIVSMRDGQIVMQDTSA